MIKLNNFFKEKNVRYAVYAPCLSHIHDDKIALSNISSKRIGPFGLICHIKHPGTGGIKRIWTKFDMKHVGTMMIIFYVFH